MDLTNKLFRGDRAIWIIFMLLCSISLVEVYSASSTLAYKMAHYYTPIVRHGIFLLIGAFGVLFIHNIHYRFFSAAILLMPLSIALLIFTLFFGVSANDANRWLSIAGIQFQPSEIAKMACVVFVAFMLSRRERFGEKQTFWIILSGIGLTCACIFPENFSTAFLLGLICLFMMFIGQISFKRLCKLVGIIIAIGSFVFIVVHFTPESTAEKYMPKRFVTWKHRVDSFFNNEQDGGNKFDPTVAFNDDNYQLSHAKIAIARGGSKIFGYMPGNSVERDYIPQAYSDFIYAVIIEELGLCGGIGVLILYIFLMFRVAIIAKRCEKLFPKYLVLGCGLLIVVQAFMNMAVAVNLIPVTGQPLPLISRGGTSTMLTCLYFGIILSISRFGAGINNGEIIDAEGDNEPISIDDETETDGEETDDSEPNDTVKVLENIELNSGNKQR